VKVLRRESKRKKLKSLKASLSRHLLLIHKVSKLLKSAFCNRIIRHRGAGSPQMWVLAPPAACHMWRSETQKRRQQREAGRNHIWMKNIWTSPPAYMRGSALTPGLNIPTQRHIDWPSARVFLRPTSPADDGSVLDVLDRDPRPPHCLWVLPAAGFFSLCLGVVWRAEQRGWMERGVALFWKNMLIFKEQDNKMKTSPEDPFSWFWLDKTKALWKCADSWS